MRGQTEWNLAHHFANEVHKLLNKYDCDLDVTKLNIGNKRPDIIILKRGVNTENLLVIEVKRNAENAVLHNDRQKIREAWFRHPLNYKFGAIVNLSESECIGVEVFENNGGAK